MIARTWHGSTKAEDGQAYLEYLRSSGFAEYQATKGNLGVLGLRQVADGRAEFLLISLWDSEDAIRRFAGDEIEKAVFYPEDERFLVQKDEHVTHYEVVFESAPVGQG